MDDLTLMLVVLVFFTGLALYFATVASARVAPPPYPPARKPAGGIHVPAVLRSNVAVAHFMNESFLLTTTRD